MKSFKRKLSVKISKGYRLQRSTPELIEKVQRITNGSKDAVIKPQSKITSIV